MSPREAREASMLWVNRNGTDAPDDGEERVELLGGVRWVDCGDLFLGLQRTAPRRPVALLERLRPVIQAGLFLVTLGGHSTPYHVLAENCPLNRDNSSSHRAPPPYVQRTHADIEWTAA